MTRPIVFLTDYGLSDDFVGICHGVIARIAPEARIVDLTHAIPRHDVGQGALALARATPFMPSDAVYLAVVDPGVGSDRRGVAVRAGSGALLVGPDNGLLSIAWESLGGAEEAVEVVSDRVVLHPASRTFHGRDVFAPAAAHLATGTALADLGPGLDAVSLLSLTLPVPTIARGTVRARVMSVDGFGNLRMNARPEDLEAAGLGDVLAVAGHDVPRVGTFADVAEGGLAAIVDSQGQLSLVVNRGSAAELLGLSVGATVLIE
jgi:S-adenosyl-L-methionine hydrolase (adenosine-forming)